MADEKTAPAEPRGFGEHSRGLAGEYAHEQGWGLNESERTHQPSEPQDVDGGNDYEYGAQHFGDEPVNVAIDHSTDSPETVGANGPTNTPGDAGNAAPSSNR